MQWWVSEWGSNDAPIHMHTNTNLLGEKWKKTHTCLATPKSASLTSPFGPTSMFAPFMSLSNKELYTDLLFNWTWKTVIV